MREALKIRSQWPVTVVYIGDGKFEKHITQKVPKDELPASFAQLAITAYAGDE
jgi:hypothetical protein